MLHLPCMFSTAPTCENYMSLMQWPEEACWWRKIFPNASINVLGKVQQGVIACNLFTEDWFPFCDPPTRQQWAGPGLPWTSIRSVVFTPCNQPRTHKAVQRVEVMSWLEKAVTIPGGWYLWPLDPGLLLQVSGDFYSKMQMSSSWQHSIITLLPLTFLCFLFNYFSHVAVTPPPKLFLSEEK